MTFLGMMDREGQEKEVQALQRGAGQVTKG